MKKKLVIPGVVVALALVAGITVKAYGQAVPHKVQTVGCRASEYSIPPFAKGLLYDGNHLPKVYQYTKTKAADAPYAGSYTRNYRAAKLNLKTMELAPFEKGKKHTAALVYVDKSATCGSIYVSISHGPFQLAVYKKAAK